MPHMHELAIAQQLIEKAASSLPAGTTGRVRTVLVQLGPLAGVSVDELRFGFSVAATGTPFAGAQLKIVETPVVVYCAECQAESPLSAPVYTLFCPRCDATAVRLVHGKELILTSFEVEDELATA
jgi:hydrogenase nickel incorporation protein HypA/HybF